MQASIETQDKFQHQDKSGHFFKNPENKENQGELTGLPVVLQPDSPA
jgi:hypothetical protein